MELLYTVRIVCYGTYLCDNYHFDRYVRLTNPILIPDSKKPHLPTGGGDAGAAGNESGIRGLMRQHHRMMMEAKLDTSWDM